MTVYNSTTHEVNTSNADASGLVFAAFLEDSNTLPVLGTEAADNSTGAAIGGWEQSGTSRLSYNIPAGLNVDTGTVFLQMERITSPASTFSRFFDTGGTELDLILGGNFTTPRLALNGNNNNFGTTFDFSTGSASHTYFSMWDRVAQTKKFTYDGSVETLTSQSWSTASLTGSTLEFLNSPAGNRGLRQRVKFAFFWDRVLSDAEAARVAADPYQLVRLAGGLAIDSEPVDIRATESFSIVVSTPTTAPTTGNTTGNLNGVTGIAPTSVTGSDPYTLNFTLPRTTAKLFDATGYTFDIDVNGETASTSVTPYLPATGNGYVTIGTVDTGSEIYSQYSGTAPVTGDQAVWSTSSVPDGSTITVADTLAWTFTPTVTQDQTSTVYMIAQAGTVGPEDTITWTAPSGAGIPVESRVTFQAMVGYLITQGYQGAGNETIYKWLVAEGISKSTFNKMLSDYLSGLGYNGVLPEQLRDWRKDA